LNASTVPIAEVISKPDTVTGVVLTTVGKVASTFIVGKVEISIISTVSAVRVPTAEVIDCPVGSTEYSTPHPELPHCCLPQPSTLNDCGVPNADIVPGEVIDTTISSDCHVLAPQVLLPQVDAIRKASLC